MLTYSIKRTVNGQEMTFELTDDELFAASTIFNKKFFYDEISNACDATEEIYLNITNDANDNWESGDFETQYDCIVKALDDAVENGDIEEYTIQKG